MKQQNSNLPADAQENIFTTLHCKARQAHFCIKLPERRTTTVVSGAPKSWMDLVQSGKNSLHERVADWKRLRRRHSDDLRRRSSGLIISTLFGALIDFTDARRSICIGFSRKEEDTPQRQAISFRTIPPQGGDDDPLLTRTVGEPLLAHARYAESWIVQRLLGKTSGNWEEFRSFGDENLIVAVGLPLREHIGLFRQIGERIIYQQKTVSLYAMIVAVLKTTYHGPPTHAESSTALPLLVQVDYGKSCACLRSQSFKA